jgi:DNA-binding transcriptional MerR regulator
MNTYKLSNIPLKTFIWFLEHQKCKHIRTTGGHYNYTRADLLRPITFQSHIDPVPEFIIKQCLSYLGFTKKEFHEYLQKHY